MIIRSAISDRDYHAFGGVVRDYVAWCRNRYADDQWIINVAFSQQSLGTELKDLSVTYGPPNGKTLLAVVDGEIQGACAYRRLSADICEMKKMFVRSGCQGKGIGQQLGQAIIDLARKDGFTLMRLDTASLLKEAIAMYQSMGFKECPAYNEYPPELLPYVVWMELPLAVRD